MMDDLKRYLSDRLLSEEQPVTYRLLSRALNLHVNAAKRALYEFHQYQNELRPNSVFATYLISGTKSDSLENASPAFSQDSLEDTSPTTTITLVAEEKLQGVLDEYHQVDSIHVYSLAPHPPRDLSLLSSVAPAVFEYTAKDEQTMTQDMQKYGVILNPKARRRPRKGISTPAPVAPKPSTSTSKPVKTEPVPAAFTTTTAAKAVGGGKMKPEPAETATATATAPSEPAPASQAKKPAAATKRGQGSSIMQSFAKAAAKPKPPVKEKKAKDEDEDMMALSDDGEADDSDLPAATSKQTAEAEAALIKSRRQREEDLRRMMEDFDKKEFQDSGGQVEEEVASGDENEDEEMEDAQEPEPEPEPEPTVEEKPAEIVSSTGQGRRRGKRRVMKKKRILDDKGYMVTIQEEGWESFSEDEAPAAKPSAPPAPPASKGKKPAKGAGQGNIMSFFTKR